MIVAFLAAAAAYTLFGDQIRDRFRLICGAAGDLPIERKHVVGAALVAAAAVAWMAGRPAAPGPQPSPPPAPRLDLRGTFVGPEAATDAATVSALLDELASEIEWDGKQPEPLIRTGVAIDDLRQRARELRCRGVSIGDRNPRARDAIRDYLDKNAGRGGGPLTLEQRAAWVNAFRDLARAAADASR